MIKNVLIPEKIRSYYLFPKRILGIEFEKTTIHASLIYFNGNNIKIEKFFTISLEKNNDTYAERVTKGLKELILQAGSFDAIHTALPSSFVVFKELRLPFFDREKIAMVLDFEVEPLLPFPLDEAIIDFIITKKLDDELGTEVLVAAVQKRYIAEHLHLFDSISIKPDVITVDLFALYGLYQYMPLNTQINGAVSFVALDSHVTRIGYSSDQQLRFIRTLPIGLNNVAKKIGTQLNMKPMQVMEDLVRFGVEQKSSSPFQTQLKNEIGALLKKIMFTLNSFANKEENSPNKKQTILLFGKGATIKGMENFVISTTGAHCLILHLHDLLQNQSLNIKIKNGMPQTAIVSFGCALLNPSIENFNLRKKEFSQESEEKIVDKQIIATAVLTFTLMTILFIHSFFQTKKLKNAISTAKKEIVTSLRKEFKKLPSPEEDIEEIVNAAQRALQKEKKIWSALANPYRLSPLHYLLELTNKIDKERLGFIISKLNITDNIMTLSARVNNHNTLVLLEKELRKSNLFIQIEGDLDEPIFTMKIKLAQNL
jgi:type IV pilus assembly protein PilM